MTHSFTPAKSSLRFSRLLLLGGLALAPSLRAELITQTGYNGGGESWETGADWSNGLPAQAGNDYINNAGLNTLLSRTPEGTSVEFPGDSLTIANTSVIYARAATVTIADFRLDNGQMAFADDTYPEAIELAGGLTLLAGGGYFNTAHGDYAGVFEITADISGVGALNAQMMPIAFADPSTTTSTVEIVLSGNNTYEGGTLAGLRGIVTTMADGALGTGDVTVSSTGQLNLGGGTTHDYIDDAATLTVEAGGLVDLNFTGTDTVGAVVLDGTEGETGTYGAVGSGADHESAVSPARACSRSRRSRR
ncbi:MAG: Autotransporter-associated beta strand repeat protein [Puniceicoccaceae bacterium 5H]|nr:MAG: Autotransporter-associated beta strand repeat protein [Puniceicoccaceae bacterium 5H]